MRHRPPLRRMRPPPPERLRKPRPSWRTCARRTDLGCGLCVPPAATRQRRTALRRSTPGAGVEGEAGDRRTPCLAAVARHHVRPVVVLEARASSRRHRRDRCRDRDSRSRRRTEARRLVAWPAEGRDGGLWRRLMVDLFPGAPADVADPEVARPRPQGEPERGEAPRRRRSSRSRHCSPPGGCGQSGDRGGVDAEHGPAEERRSRHQVKAEGTQGTPLGGRRWLRSRRVRAIGAFLRPHRTDVLRRRRARR